MDVPRDRFENKFITISLGLRCVALTAAGGLFILTTVSLIMFIVFVDTPEIKAASPILSTVILHRLLFFEYRGNIDFFEGFCYSRVKHHPLYRDMQY